MRKKSNKLWLLHIPMILFAVTILVPLLTMISSSISGVVSGFSIIPPKIDLLGWELIFKNPQVIVNGYRTSLIVTVMGTLLSMLVSSGVAYALSRTDFRHRNKISFYVYFTMLFSGGLVPTYILVTQILNLKDTIWALTLPYLVIPFYVLMLRTFMQTIPREIIESCYVDGASEYRIFAQFILPLSKPGLATVALFTTFNYWNDWWLSLLYIEDHNMVPLQGALTRIMNNIMFLRNTVSTIPAGMTMQQLPGSSMRMAMALLTAGPILLVFPFFQKQFVKGLTVGALKG